MQEPSRRSSAFWRMKTLAALQSSRSPPSTAALQVPVNEAVVDPKEAAESAGLIYVTDDRPGVRRRRSGKGFSYFDERLGKTISDPAVLKRLRSLAIPPAWTEVWICSKADGHLQATGRDARGRKQYRYHSKFREVRDSTKFHRMLSFADNLPAIRRAVQDHLSQRGLTRDKVLATVVHLLDSTLIRVGSDEYARENNSYGLTTLKNRHVEVDGHALKFNFKGKSGRIWKLDIHDRRVAKVIRACQELPGQDLFQYVDENGDVRDVSSSDVNAYLRELTGEDVTAKDFRTWHGTVLAAIALAEFEKFDGQAGAKKNIRSAIQKVASRLGNTPTICRQCYVHPEILTTYVEGSLLLEVQKKVEKELREDIATLRPEEVAVLALLRTRLSLTVTDKLKKSVATFTRGQSN